MKLNDQVVGLELAKRLSELGVGQDSMFWWVFSPRLEKFELRDKQELMGFIGDDDGAWLYLDEAKHRCHAFAAFTVAELGEMPPATVTCQNGNYKLQCMKQTKWEVK